jgi:hypothetical protein
MTETEWLTATDGVALANHWGDGLTERKARLIMVACCRRHQRFVKHKSIREALAAVVAHYADPTADAPLDGDRFRRLQEAARQTAEARRQGAVRGLAFAVMAAIEPTSMMQQSWRTFRFLVFSCLTDIEGGVQYESIDDEQAAQAKLVREVLGNPFQKVKVKPAWRTDTVMTLACQMYATEEFGAMPILADALQDAGCDSDAILDHCRDASLLSGEPTGSPAPPVSHVRGCWVLDLLLKKK